MCSVLHCFRHTTEMLLIIPDVKSIASPTLSASIHTDMSRLRFMCFIHLGMPPVVTGSPLVARCGPLGRCLPRGARQPCGRLPGFRRVVAQNNTAIMDGRPGHSRTRIGDKPQGDSLARGAHPTNQFHWLAVRCDPQAAPWLVSNNYPPPRSPAHSARTLPTRFSVHCTSFPARAPACEA